MYLSRERSGNLKRRAEVRHIQQHAIENAMRLSRTDPSYAIPTRNAKNALVVDTAVVDVSAVTNESNNFYSNFCVDLTEKILAASSSCSIPVACLASSSSSDSSEADIDVHTDEMNPEIPERDGADASA